MAKFPDSLLTTFIFSSLPKADFINPSKGSVTDFENQDLSSDTIVLLS